MRELYTFEHTLAIQRPVAGTDEAGSGPLAGPAVAAAVILPDDRCLLGLDDSKKLSAKQREIAYEQIISQASAYSIVIASLEDIDTLNIYWACIKAMRQALESLKIAPAFVLTDARPIPGLPFRQQAVIKGDAKCASIAAASILAKVHRDRLMVELEQQYPGYGFAAHKGYATTEHLAALDKLGPCPAHRRSFAPVREKQTSQLSLDYEA